MNPARLSRELRRGSGLSLVSSAAMAMVGMYQIGILRHIPEPPLPLLDADKVDASAEAYARFSVPDAFLGLGSYAATALLAAMGGRRRPPLLPLALASKAAFDAAQAGKLSWDQWARHRAFCSWCLLAAAATFAALPLTLPESRRALSALGRGRT